MQETLAVLPEIEMSFAAKLRELRAAAGLSQSGLARASGISVRIIQGYEQGQRQPTLGYAVRLAKGLGVSMDQFADCDFDEDVPQQPTPKRKRPGK